MTIFNRRLQFTKLPVDLDGNIFVITGFISRCLRKCGATATELAVFQNEVHAAGSYAKALDVCAEYIDMDDWREHNDL